MTNVDSNNTATYLSFTISDTPDQIKAMRADSEANGMNGDDGKEKNFYINSMEGYSLVPNELYLEIDKIPEIYCSFEIRGEHGTGYVSINIPLTDVLLIDILSYGVKKFNKLKTAIEAVQ